MNDNHNEKPKHIKICENNIIRKIKTQIFEYILKKLNLSIKFKSGRFRPLNKEIKENLKKDKNLELLNRTIGDIFSNTRMNRISEKKGQSNKSLIKKINEENIEKETIKILSMKFIEILNEIKEHNLEDFLKIIKEKETKIQSKKKENFDIESYMNEIKTLLFNYEYWFLIKLGRNRKK